MSDSGSRPQGVLVSVVIQDSDRLARVGSVLSAFGATVEKSADLGEVLESPDSDRVDVVVTDHVDAGGAALSELLSRRTPPVVVIVGSAEAGVRCLAAGAADYAVAPVDESEVAARAIARAEASRRSTLDFGELRIDLEARSVSVAGEPILLAPREYDLLVYLVHRPQLVISRTELLAGVWGAAPEWLGERTVTEHIHRLRAKLGASVEHRRWITTVRGGGYRFDP